MDGKNSVRSGGALVGTLSSRMLAMLFAFDKVGLLGRGRKLLKSLKLGEFFDSLGRADWSGLPNRGELSGVDDDGSGFEERSSDDTKGSCGRDG